MAKEDIKPFEGPQFSWKDGERLKSLMAVYSNVCGKIDDSVKWYQSARVTKRKMGVFTRYMGILLGVLAAAIPTLTEIALRTNAPLEWWQRPGIATVLGVIVGGLYLLDRFSGGTSGWIRYTMAETALKELRDELTFAYTIEEAQWAGQNEPTVEQTKHTLTTLQGFLTRANQIVRNETDQWKSEFQNALQQVDEYAKAQPKKAEEAVGTVKIANPDRLAGKWCVSFNDGPDQEAVGDSKSFRLTPGSVVIRVSARIKANADGTQTRTFNTEVAETLAAGTPKTIQISLPPS